MKAKKAITRFRPKILSRHPSHDVLRVDKKLIALTPYQSVVRFGSTTECDDTVAKGGRRIEINSIQSIKNSANKLLMKRLFTEAGVKTAPWTEDVNQAATLEFPIVAKAHFGSKGRGNTLIRTAAEFDSWKEGKTLSNYIFEKFMNYALEYRLHITADGCFYACRKALKADAPEDQRWRRHDDICVWFLESNENFLKPNSWDTIVADCVKALETVGADLLSFDVRVQSATDREGRPRQVQDWILLECNSASSMDNGTGEISVCAQKYIEEIPKIITRKARV